MNLHSELLRARSMCRLVAALASEAGAANNPHATLTDMAATTQKLHELALALVQVTKG